MKTICIALAVVVLGITCILGVRAGVREQPAGPTAAAPERPALAPAAGAEEEAALRAERRKNARIYAQAVARIKSLRASERRDVETAPEFTDEELAAKDGILNSLDGDRVTASAMALSEIVGEEKKNEQRTLETRAAADQVMRDPELAGTQIDTLDCFETICKGLVTSKDMEAYQRFTEKGMRSEALWGPSMGFQTTNPDGTVRYEFYFAKPGEDYLIHDEVALRAYEKLHPEDRDGNDLN